MGTDGKFPRVWQRLYSWVAYRLRPCLTQTVGHSSPVLSYLLTDHYSLLTCNFLFRLR